MKNIITAIGNIKLNLELKKDDYFNVVYQDIQYQEGIFEIMDQKKDIDFLIISQNIPGEMNFLEFIKKVKNLNSRISIYVILEEKNENIENELNFIKINKIFYSNQIEIKELINFIKNDKKTDEENLKDEIEKLRQLIINSNMKNNMVCEDVEKFESNNEKKLISIFKENIKKSKFSEEERKILSICISGVYGTGKSIITLLIARYYESLNKKVLVIDGDIYNQSIHTILGMKKIKNDDKKYYDITKKISILPNVEDFLENDNTLKLDKYNRFINYIKNEFDVLLIDTTSKMNDEYIKKFLKLSNKIIFLVEPNLSEISKSRNLLDYYLYKLNINKEKINIVFNKVNKKVIDESVLKNLFFGIKIIGKIEYMKDFTECINSNKIKCLNNKLLKSLKLD